MFPLDARGGAQGIGLVGAFPGEIKVLAAEMSECGYGSVDGTAQVQRFDDAAWSQIKVFADERGDLGVRDLSSAARFDHQGYRFGFADGVCDLHFGAFSQAGGDDVLGNVPSRVCAGSVDFRRVFGRRNAPPPCRALPP